MTKSSVDQWDTTAANNTDVGGISLAESVMKAPAVNNAFREIMAQIWAWFSTALFFLRDGTDGTKKVAFDISAITTGTTRTITVPDADITLGNLVSSSTDNAVVRFDGTTGAMQNSTVTVSDTGAVAAASLALTTALPVSSGGTGVGTLTGLVKGNGTSAMTAATAGTDYMVPVSTTTDNAIVRFNGTAGGQQNSGVTIDDTNNVSGPATLTVTSGLPSLKFVESDSSNKAWFIGGADGTVSIWEDTQAGANNRLQISAGGAVALGGTVSPLTSDGAALGTSSKMWSDLFLASGGVINFNAGDVTVTHSADTLAFAGASSGYTFDSTIAITNAAPSLTLTESDESNKKWIVLGAGTTFSIFEDTTAGANNRLQITAGGTITIGAGALIGGPIPTSSTLPVGWSGRANNGSGSSIADGGTTTGANIKPAVGSSDAIGVAQTGTWKNISGASVASPGIGIFVRTA